MKKITANLIGNNHYRIGFRGRCPDLIPLAKPAPSNDT